MIQVDIVTLFFLMAMFISAIVVIIGEYNITDTKKYKELRRRYRRLQREYMKLMDVLEEVETEES